MNMPIKLTKDQEPWIGSRGRIGVIIPSTNIGVEHDCQRVIFLRVRDQEADQEAFAASGGTGQRPESRTLACYQLCRTRHRFGSGKDLPPGLRAGRRR